MFVSSNRVEPAFVNVARKGLNGQRAGLRIRVVPRHLLKERARCDHCHLHREIVMGRSELLDRRVSELVLAESTRGVDSNDPPNHTDSPRRSRTSSRSYFEWFFPHTERSTKKVSQARRMRNLPNRVAYLIVVFIHIILISKIFALLIEFFGQCVSSWNQDESKDTRRELPSECSIDHNDR